MLDLLFDLPIVGVPALSRRLGVTFAAANRVVERLLEAGIVVETSGQRRDRRFHFQPYLDLFE